MRRTEQFQGLRLMKFEGVYGRSCRGDLSQAEAAEILGVSERTFRRWRVRFEADGAEGLYDRRLGKVSVRRAPVDEVARVLALFDTHYFDFTPKHFHEKLVSGHGFTLSYNWVRLTLQAHGRVTPAPRRGAHRRKRPRRPMEGMMLHQDGSRHSGWQARAGILIVTLDDATSAIYSAFFVEEEGTMSTFRALTDVIAGHGLFCALYADRGSHYWHTPEAGGKVDKDNPTQVGRALAQLGIDIDSGLFAGGARPVGADVRYPAGPAAKGAQAGRHYQHGRGQPVSEGSLSARAQRPLRPAAGRGRLGVRTVLRHPRRHPLRPGGTGRRQRQYRPL